MSYGLDTDCLMKWLVVLMFELTVLFYFPLFLSQRELKFGMVANFLVALFAQLPSFLEGLVDFYLVVLVLTCPG